MNGTPKGRRVLTKHITVSTGAVVHATTVVAATEFVFQQDVTVIGAELSTTITMSAAALAEVGGYSVLAEVTRAAQASKDSGLLSTVSAEKHAAVALAIGVDLAKAERILLPAGYGIDYSEGEPINLIGILTSEQAAEDTLNCHVHAIIYYVLQ